jgi:hypothetical protein
MPIHHGTDLMCLFLGEHLSAAIGESYHPLGSCVGARPGVFRANCRREGQDGQEVNVCPRDVAW